MICRVCDREMLYSRIHECRIATPDAGHRAEIERLKGELAEAKHLIAEAAEATCPQRFSEPGRPAKFSDCGSCWTCRAQRFLAAPPPAESTCTASAGSCNSPKVCGEAGKCIDARMREFVAPAESTPVQPAPPDDIRERLEGRLRWHDQQFAALDKRLAALEAKGEPGTHAKGAKP